MSVEQQRFLTQASVEFINALFDTGYEKGELYFEDESIKAVEHGVVCSLLKLVEMMRSEVLSDEMVHVSDNPFVKRSLSIIRNKETTNRKFRESLNHMTFDLLAEVATRLPARHFQIETPLKTTEGFDLEDSKVVAVVVLRAGIGMLNAAEHRFRRAQIGFVDMARDEVTLEPHRTSWKVPKITPETTVLVLDPMLATGGSAHDVLHELEKSNPHQIIYVSAIGAPEGVRSVREQHPDVEVFLGALDEFLNEAGYIVPGLGDAGDRQFGQKESIE